MRIEKIAFLSVLLIVIILPSAAQLQQFSFPKDDTVLKSRFYQQSLTKKDALVASAIRAHESDYKKIYEAQFKSVGSFWQSSRAVTAPGTNAYLQSVVSRIVASNPELKTNDARIVFSRDWWPNAASMGEGTIMVNAGLMVYLDNEAELVFVICHELAHYYLDHTNKSIRKYVEKINSEEYQDELKRLSKTEYRVNQQLEQLSQSVAFDSRRHSRENEAGADRQAFLFMKRTGYDCGAITTCLQMLDKVDDSLLYKRPDIQALFDFDEYHFKKKWIQKESSIFSELRDDESSQAKKETDSLKTHPDCEKRISLLADSIRQARAGKKFLVDESKFQKLRKEFFAEMTEECYRGQNLSRNLYYSLLLLQSQEDTPFAVYSVVRCLNRIFELQKEHKLGSMVDAESKSYAAEYNLLLRMLDRLRLDELANLSYSFATRYKPLMKNYSGFEEEMTKAQKLKN